MFRTLFLRVLSSSVGKTNSVIPHLFSPCKICSQTTDYAFWTLKSLSSISDVSFLFWSRVYGGTATYKGSKESIALWKCLKEGPYCVSYWLCEKDAFWQKKRTLWAASSWTQGSLTACQPPLFAVSQKTYVSAANYSHGVPKVWVHRAPTGDRNSLHCLVPRARVLWQCVPDVLGAILSVVL
jgi:hypothetical protein